MELFDGIGFAKQRELQLKERVIHLLQTGVKPSIVSIVFSEDAGSRLYTQKKLEAAERVGIDFRPIYFSLNDSMSLISESINRLNNDPIITGLMIQKPSQKTWQSRVGDGDFSDWWRSMVTSLDPKKDVDGLTPSTQLAIKDGNWLEKGFVLPATAQAILLVLQQAKVTREDVIAIIGRSDIVGSPTHNALKSLGYQSTLLGRKNLAERNASNQHLSEFDVVISATGVENLITGAMLKEKVILIDVGEPKPDINRLSVETIAVFLSPVPGGVGPVTVVCLLENVINLLNDESRNTNMLL